MVKFEVWVKKYTQISDRFMQNKNPGTFYLFIFYTISIFLSFNSKKLEFIQHFQMHFPALKRKYNCISLA